ncbi:uncharacterized protein [Malus domestica]|uniref:uncharacterized protein n=1 Tax=Malus domestica TaxID=3750 RepID=UPI003976CCFD
MTVVLHYANKKGEAIEKFLDVQHVSSTTSSSLEEAIERLFATTNLSMSKLRGQGYDGASNMKVSIIAMFEAVVEVLEWIKDDTNQDNFNEAMNNFASFDKAKIVRLSQLYPQDFDCMDLMNLPIQLDNYIHNMKMHSEFSSLREICDLAKELVKTRRCASYMLVYKLLTLALVLPIATASVERAFSAMKIVKTPLGNNMGDQWLSDSMLVYIERDVFAFIDNEPICDVFMI